MAGRDDLEAIFDGIDKRAMGLTTRLRQVNDLINKTGAEGDTAIARFAEKVSDRVSVLTVAAEELKEAERLLEAGPMSKTGKPLHGAAAKGPMERLQSGVAQKRAAYQAAQENLKNSRFLSDELDVLIDELKGVNRSIKEQTKQDQNNTKEIVTTHRSIAAKTRNMTFDTRFGANTRGGSISGNSILGNFSAEEQDVLREGLSLRDALQSKKFSGTLDKDQIKAIKAVEDLDKAIRNQVTNQRQAAEMMKKYHESLRKESEKSSSAIVNNTNKQKRVTQDLVKETLKRIRAGERLTSQQLKLVRSTVEAADKSKQFTEDQRRLAASLNLVKNRLNEVDGVIQLTSKSSEGMLKAFSRLRNTLLVFMFAVRPVIDFFTQSVLKFREFSKAMEGVDRIGAKFNNTSGAMRKAMESLTKDGLLSLQEAAAGLRNLLASGLNLEQATDLMNRFKDSAAFNRQGTLELGQAVVGATDGFKNFNSRMLDNAGITKNISNILKEQAKLRGLEVAALSEQAKAQLLYNGLVKESAIFVGDASVAANTLDGSMTRLGRSWDYFAYSVGESIAGPLGSAIDWANTILSKMKSIRQEAAMTAEQSAMEALAGIGDTSSDSYLTMQAKVDKQKFERQRDILTQMGTNEIGNQAHLEGAGDLYKLNGEAFGNMYKYLQNRIMGPASTYNQSLFDQMMKDGEVTNVGRSVVAYQMSAINTRNKGDLSSEYYAAIDDFIKLSDDISLQGKERETALGAAYERLSTATTSLQKELDKVEIEGINALKEAGQVKYAGLISHSSDYARGQLADTLGAAAQNAAVQRYFDSQKTEPAKNVEDLTELLDAINKTAGQALPDLAQKIKNAQMHLESERMEVLKALDEGANTTALAERFDPNYDPNSNEIIVNDVRKAINQHYKDLEEKLTNEFKNEYLDHSRRLADGFKKSFHSSQKDPLADEMENRQEANRIHYEKVKDDLQKKVDGAEGALAREVIVNAMALALGVVDSNSLDDIFAKVDEMKFAQDKRIEYEVQRKRDLAKLASINAAGQQEQSKIDAIYRLEMQGLTNAALQESVGGEYSSFDSLDAQAIEAYGKERYEAAIKRIKESREQVTKTLSESLASYNAQKSAAEKLIDTNERKLALGKIESQQTLSQILSDTRLGELREQELKLIKAVLDALEKRRKASENDFGLAQLESGLRSLASTFRSFNREQQDGWADQITKVAHMVDSIQRLQNAYGALQAVADKGGLAAVNPTLALVSAGIQMVSSVVSLFVDDEQKEKNRRRKLNRQNDIGATINRGPNTININPSLIVSADGDVYFSQDSMEIVRGQLIDQVQRSYDMNEITPVGQYY